MWCWWGRWGAPYQQSAGAAHLEVKATCIGRTQIDVLLLAQELTEVLKKLPTGDEVLARICFSSCCSIQVTCPWLLPTGEQLDFLSYPPLSPCSGLLWWGLPWAMTIVTSAISSLEALGGNTTSPHFYLWYCETWCKGTAGHCCLQTARWGHAMGWMVLPMGRWLLNVGCTGFCLIY